MSSTQYKQQTLGNIVTENFKAASIFTEAGIDFCCGGKMTLDEACMDKNIDPEKMASKLAESAELPVTPGQNFKEWSLDFLADYIMNTHHKYVTKNLPVLSFYTQKIAEVHGEHHPELIEIASIYSEIQTELTQHLKNEEEVLFPAVKEVLQNGSEAAKKTIKSEIERMNDEHDFAGGAMDKINVISNGYKLPADACETYQVTFKLLKEFEDDLHIHVHLENNLLFPKALAL